MRRFFIMFLFLGCAAGAWGQEAGKNRRVYYTHHVNPHAPVIDGQFDDRAWDKVEWAGDFTQRRPDDGARPTFQSAFKIIYDDDNLYVTIRAFDPEPAKIERRVTRRDDLEGDWVAVLFDSYLDHRTAFGFLITAAGVKGDAIFANDGDSEDFNWNPVWYGATKITAEGWVAELKIPFSQLRFANKDEQVWGLQVIRQLFRKDEESDWQPIAKNAPGWVSFFGELRGLNGVHSRRRAEVLPYTVSNLRRFQAEAGNPFATGQTTKLAGGLDAKLGVTSDLTLDLTVNPDFGQVEADPSELNLSAFETFFEEKRPFFIEGQNILEFGLMGGDGPFSNDRLFYSRRIGRTPHLQPELGENEFSNLPPNTSIAAAMKLTGKTRHGLSVGILNALTTREAAEIAALGHRRHETVEPLTNYFLARLQKDYQEGTTSIGGIFTATNRDLSSEALRILPHSAYTGGVDFRHQWSDRTYSVDFRAAFSHVRGAADAIYDLQTSSRRYYQRPDASYLHLDPSRTSLSGHGGFLSFNRSGNSKLRLSIGGMWRSPGFELNDIGFLRQADRTMQYAWLGYRQPNPLWIFRQLNVNLNQWWGGDFGRERVFSGGNINGGGDLKNYWSIWMGIGREGGSLSTAELRGGPALKLPGQWNVWYNVNSDNRKALQFGFGGFIAHPDQGESQFRNYRFWLNYRPSDALSIRVNPFLSLNKDNLQYLEMDEIQGQTRYLFGRIDQKTLGIVLRMNYSITPDLSVQYYGQPFVSTGKYSRIKKITQSRAERYADRFHTFTAEEISFEQNAYRIHDGGLEYSLGNPNFNFQEFRSNLVIRWEYLPGSTLFVVWSQGRSAFDEGNTISFNRALRELYDIYPDNVFLIKVNRWFSL